MKQSFFIRNVEPQVTTHAEADLARPASAQGALRMPLQVSESIRLSADHGHVPEFHQQISPNADERPAPHDISLLVIHSISLPEGQFGPRADGSRAVDELFMNTLTARDLSDPARAFFGAGEVPQVSAHVCIWRDGSATQYVDFHRRAWHAGASSWDGRNRCNDFSIGVELEGDGVSAYTDAQYRQLARLANALCSAFPALTPARIVGHADIAPLRKTDPGAAFDWQRLHFEMEFPR